MSKVSDAINQLLEDPSKWRIIDHDQILHDPSGFYLYRFHSIFIFRLWDTCGTIENDLSISDAMSIRKSANLVLAFLKRKKKRISKEQKEKKIDKLLKRIQSTEAPYE